MTLDPYNLDRFVQAQDSVYRRALTELQSGRKLSHWMWFIFPQLGGLGHSPTARRYEITGLAEARAYLDHPVLGPRLVEAAEAAVNVPGRSAAEVFGYPDDLKLRSCATLFRAAAPAGSVFERILGRYFDGVPDPTTLHLLGMEPGDADRERGSGPEASAP